VTVLGTAGQLRAAGLSWTECRRPGHRPYGLLHRTGLHRTGLHRTGRSIGTLVGAIDRRMYLALGALLTLVGLAVTVLRLGYRSRAAAG